MGREADAAETCRRLRERLRTGGKERRELLEVATVLTLLVEMVQRRLWGEVGEEHVRAEVGVAIRQLRQLASSMDVLRNHAQSMAVPELHGSLTTAADGLTNILESL